jgi:MFS transporter, putative metabolite transport protein
MPALSLTSTEIGLIGAAGLVGVFVGGMLFGYLTDRRQFMYIADLIALALFSILSAFAGEAWQLVILRFLLGVAIGADYPIATSRLAECSPKKYRGFLWAPCSWSGQFDHWSTDTAPLADPRIYLGHLGVES